jgi:hypothetical protein
MTQLDEPVFMGVISYRFGGMHCVEYPTDTLGNAHASVGIRRCFRSDVHSDIVEAIWDCETSTV